MKSECIEFFNNEPSIIENYPIIESKDLKLDWVKKARENFQKEAQEGNTNTPHFTHISRCPGIFDLFKYGYVVTLHRDVIIKPDGENFGWQVPHRWGTQGMVGEMAISGQEGALLPRPPWAAEFIVKINTGWWVIAPKGLKFLMLPIAYPDTFDFTSTMGIMNPAISGALNFQMFWNTTESETLIRAGTPLGHLIPLTEKKYKWTQRVMNEKDKEWLRKFHSAYSSTFWHSALRSKMIAMYNKYWKRK